MLLDDFAEPTRDIERELAETPLPSGREILSSISGMPRRLRRAIEIVARAVRISQEATVRLLLDKGARLLWTVPAIAIIRDCREQAISAASDESQFFESWAFKLLPDDEEQATRYFVRLTDREVKALSALAVSMGLPTSTVAVLALMAILVQAREVPDSSKRWMLACLADFIQKVEKRAERAEAKCAGLRPDTRALMVSWDDVLAQASRTAETTRQ